jgi:LytS/YehU family sensor histidine kinase
VPSGDCLELRVEDDGVGLRHDWRPETSAGLGLRVTRERLEGLYPNIERPLEIRRRTPDGTEVIMRVPARVAEVV